MVEGQLAGLSVVEFLGLKTSESLRLECMNELDALRRGPAGYRIRAGIAKTFVPYGRETKINNTKISYGTNTV